MRLFTSKRERSLWLWTLTILVLIYSTLGAAPTAAAFLRDRGLFEFTFGSVLAAGLAFFAYRWVKIKKPREEIWVALGALFVYSWTLLRIESPEERTHLIEYSIVAALIYHALKERAAQGRKVWNPALLTIAATSLLGLLDEGIQNLLPNRVFDWIDVGFNAFAGILAVGANLATERVRKRRSR